MDNGIAANQLYCEEFIVTEVALVCNTIIFHHPENLLYFIAVIGYLPYIPTINNKKSAL